LPIGVGNRSASVVRGSLRLITSAEWMMRIGDDVRTIALGSFTARRAALTVATLLLWGCDRNQASRAPADSPTTVVASGSWLVNPERLDSADACAGALRRQLSDLRADTLSTTFTFGRYPARSMSAMRPAPLDPSSLRSAGTFRTKLREALDTAGINFAGHLAIVEVGMTGWGPNYWIVERRTGRVFEFPYKATYLDFTDSSTLMIMDSKDAIVRALRRMADYQEACSNIGPRRHTDLRPFYFRWQNRRIEQLAPAGITPPPNTFWKDYFGG
jgi:hypothetical protein